MTSNTALLCEKLLRQSHLTIATAESCTGGLIASEFISIAGSSDWFREGCVTYTVEAKISRLGVKPETIDTHTIVSSEVALEMAQGVRTNLNADIGLSTTGYAGPGGGDKNNPVGTVFGGVSIGDCCNTKRLSLSGNRNEIRAQAMEQALLFLHSELENYISLH